MNSPIEIASGNGGVPIKCFLTPELLPDDETRAQLENLAATPGLQQHVAVLPDIHRKSRNLSPTGTVVAGKNAVVPRAVDTGICCGIRMIRTDFPVRHLHASALDALFEALKTSIPVYEHQHDVINKDEMAELLARGGEWCRKKFNLGSAELDNIEDRGFGMADTDDAAALLASMPEKAIKKGRRCLGTLGDGNHFLELQEIVEELEPETARQLGLRRGEAIFMLHTGSRSVGSKMMKAYLEELEPRFAGKGTKQTLWSMPADCEEGIKYLRAVAAASSFGFANRIAITEKLRAAVRQTLGDDSLQMPLLYDCAHVSIKREQWRGEELIIHRHGASRALPPGHMNGHPIYAKTGQPVPIPGSMGHASFIGVPGERAQEAFFSVNHGAGRVLDKPEALSRFTDAEVEDELRAKNVRLYRYGSDNIAEQAPASFKNISQIIHAMSALALARPVVRLRPVAVLKG